MKNSRGSTCVICGTELVAGTNASARQAKAKQGKCTECIRGGSTPLETKDQIKDQPKDQVKDQPKDQVKDQPKDQLKDQPKDQLKDQPKDQLKNQPKDQPKEPKIQPKDQPKEPKIQPKDQPKEPKVQPKDLSKDQPKGAEEKQGQKILCSVCGSEMIVGVNASKTQVKLSSSRKNGKCNECIAPTTKVGSPPPNTNPAKVPPKAAKVPLAEGKAQSLTKQEKPVLNSQQPKSSSEGVPPVSSGPFKFGNPVESLSFTGFSFAMPTTTETPEVSCDPTLAHSGPCVVTTGGNTFTLEEVAVKTFEEEEEVIFLSRALLFRFDEVEWKERGKGEIKLLKHRENGKIRVLMRRDKILKICANHYITPSMEMRPNKLLLDKSFVWQAYDSADEVPKFETLAIRFSTPENAQNWKAAFDKAKNEISNLPESPQPVTASVTHRAETPEKQNTSTLPKNAWTSTTKENTATPETEKTKSTLPKNAWTSTTKENTATPETEKTKSPGFSFDYTPPSPSGTKGFAFTTTSSPQSPGDYRTEKSKEEKNNKESPSHKEGTCTVLTGGTEYVLEVVQPKTLEEDETPLFVRRAMLFRYEDNEWKERGTGEVKLLKHNQTGKIRLLMRRDKTFKICANHMLTSGMNLRPHEMSKKSLVWTAAADIADEVPKKETFAIRFSQPEYAEAFKEAFDKSTELMKTFNSPSQTSGNSSTIFSTPERNSQASGNSSTFFSFSPVSTPSPSFSPGFAFHPQAQFSETYTPPENNTPEPPKESSYKTLEEDEDPIFTRRAKLFRFESEWKERGVGDVKLLKHQTSGKIRLLMRRDKILKICANHYVSPLMELKPFPGDKADRTWMWTAIADFSEEFSKKEIFAIQFANSENAQAFKEAFDLSKEEMNKLQSPQKTVSPKTETSPKTKPPPKKTEPSPKSKPSPKKEPSPKIEHPQKKEPSPKIEHPQKKRSLPKNRKSPKKKKIPKKRNPSVLVVESP